MKVNIKTGDRLWQLKEKGYYIALDSQLVITANSDGYLSAWSIKDGDLLWKVKHKVKLEAGIRLSKSGLTSQVLCLHIDQLTQNSLANFSFQVYDKLTGNYLWQDKGIVTEVYDNILYVEEKGRDPKTGKVLYEFPYPATTGYAGYYDKPVNYHLVKAKDKSFIFAFDYQTGKTLWTQEKLEPNQRDYQIIGANENTVYVQHSIPARGGKLVLQAFNAQNGNLKWRFDEFPQSSLSEAIDGKQSVIVSMTSPKMTYGLTHKGVIDWYVPARLNTVLGTVKNTTICLDRDKWWEASRGPQPPTLFGIDEKAGKAVWKYETPDTGLFASIVNGKVVTRSEGIYKVHNSENGNVLKQSTKKFHNVTYDIEPMIVTGEYTSDTIYTLIFFAV